MSKETNTFSIGDRVKTFTEVNGIPAGTTGTIIDELEYFDYQVKFDVPVATNTDYYETYAFNSDELEFIPYRMMTADRADKILSDHSLIDTPEWGEAYDYYVKHELTPQENASPARKLRGLTVKDLIAYYCQVEGITPEELIADFGNDEHNMNIMWMGLSYPQNAFAEIKDGKLYIGFTEAESE